MLSSPYVQQAEARTRILFHASWQTNDLCSCHHRQKLAGWMVSLDVLLQEQANCADYSGEWQVCAKEYSLLIRALFLQLFMNKPDTILRFWDRQSRSKLNRLTLKACLISDPQTLLYIQFQEQKYSPKLACSTSPNRHCNWLPIATQLN